jgi:hypothetical protein
MVSTERHTIRDTGSDNLDRMPEANGQYRWSTISRTFVGEKEKGDGR